MAFSKGIASDTNPAGRPGLPCSVGALLARLDPEEREGLQRDLGTKSNRSPYTAGQIYEKVISEGETVKFQTINRHRGETCSCFR